MEGLRMSKFHLFAGHDFDVAGGTGSYKGVYETLAQAYGAAIDEDWAELAVINEAGALEHYADLDEKIVNAGENQRARWIGWVVGDSLAIMEVKDETWIPNEPPTPSPKVLVATGLYLPGYWDASGGL